MIRSWEPVVHLIPANHRPSNISGSRYLGVHLPPVLPGLDLLGLLVPLGLADHVRQQLQQRVGETLHNLVHPDARRVTSV